jgi:hypothetical protein
LDSYDDHSRDSDDCYLLVRHDLPFHLVYLAVDPTLTARHGDTIQWRFLSLAVLNEGKEILERYRAGIAWSTKAHRVTECGLPAELLSAANDATWDKVVRNSHDEAQRRVGMATGSPVMAIDDGPAFFGPVIVSVPESEDADRLSKRCACRRRYPNSAS